MRIAMVLPSLSRSATITVALNIVSGLIDRGHHVDVLYFDEKVDRPVPKGSSAYKIAFFRRHDFSKYDIVHSHNLRPDLYVSAHKFFKNFSCVSTIHNYVAEELENYYGKVVSLIFTRIWLFAWRKFDKLVCLTDGAVGYYQALLPKSDISYVYNGVSVADTDVTPNPRLVSAVYKLKQNDYFVLGTYCNQTKGKGLEQLVRFAEADPSVAVVIIGDGPEKRNLVALAAELGVVDRCLFFPFLPSAYVYNYIFDAYVIPSRSEGFGLALVEASLCGANIMCSDIPVFREMFDDTQVSFFRLDDMEDMRRVVRQMKGGLDKRNSAKLKAVQEFSIEAMTSRYLKIYNLALNRLG